ncbi:MAG: hypothetical protein U0470_02850 [Anaerolineae bacterium]
MTATRRPRAALARPPLAVAASLAVLAAFGRPAGARTPRRTTC